MNTLGVLSGNGLLIDVAVPKIMGIVNVNDDSFYSASRAKDEDAVIRMAEKMISEGVDIIDLGFMSSRPGAQLSDPDTELSVIQNAVIAVRKRFANIFISVDTVWGKVAKAALDAGANMINDISAGEVDSSIFQVVSEYDVPYVLMHMKGTPQTMQQHADYEDVMMELLVFFSNKIRFLQGAGIHQIILDPGFGFSKKAADNFLILNNIDSFSIFDKPLLVGISRKSFIYKSLETGPEFALTGTSALHGISLYKGANILRVHDVKEAKDVIVLLEMLKKG